MGEYAQALLDRKRDLTEQLRRIDEAVDTANGHREAEDGDLPWQASAPGTEPLLTVQIDGHDYEYAAAIEATRAGLYEVDQGLDDLGLFAHDQKDTS